MSKKQKKVVSTNSSTPGWVVTNGTANTYSGYVTGSTVSVGSGSVYNTGYMQHGYTTTANFVQFVDYAWSPKEDITTYELARLMPWVTRNSMAIDTYVELDDNIRRHLEIHGYNADQARKELKKKKLKEFLDDDEGDNETESTT